MSILNVIRDWPERAHKARYMVAELVKSCPTGERQLRNYIHRLLPSRLLFSVFFAFSAVEHLFSSTLRVPTPLQA